jgi:hypothetical protein
MWHAAEPNASSGEKDPAFFDLTSTAPSGARVHCIQDPIARAC